MSSVVETIPQDARPLDLVCLGRLAVDLYGQQLGSKLEDVRTFSKYLGGSSANIAAGCARLGLKSSMISRVGDEQFGRFLRQTLEQEGCDTSQISTDPARLTALAILSVRSQDEFPLLFYRDNCADMAIRAEDIDAQHIASAKVLLITGTHFSTEGVKAASMKALEYARNTKTMCVLDIDYRPVLWGLTDKGDGDTRFIASDTVTAHMQKIIPEFDLIVGTQEEFNIAGGHDDLIASLKKVRQLTRATMVVKIGKSGCAIIEAQVPDAIEHALVSEGFAVEVLNVLGAGDAFMSGLLFGLLRGEDYETSCTIANACGALVVSRHACSPAMPTLAELDYFLENRQNIKRIDLDPALNLLHRISRKDRTFKNMAILAFDHRQQLVDAVLEAGADLEALPFIKKILLGSYQEAVKTHNLYQRAGVLIDDSWGKDLLYQITGSGIWIGRPVEQPGSRPLEFEGGRNIGQKLIEWPVDHRVKCLVFYHPDDAPEMRYEQERQLIELFRACCATGHELLLEVIPPDDVYQADSVMPRIIARFYNLGIHPHWWKLPPLSADVWREISNLIESRSPFCRGVLLLGLNAPISQLEQDFATTADFNICKGFAIGRSIFQKPVEEWLRGKLKDRELGEQVTGNYLELVNIWDRSRQ